ncbi:MAG: universal stress protein, partial [Verrucomicrobiales bacterium]
MTKKHIVVGIDFSHCSANALREATRVATSVRKVIALHVIDEWAFSRISWGNDLTKEELMRQGKEQLELWVVEQLKGAAVIQCEVVMGRPFVELVEACYRRDADLLILGVHGLEGADDRTGSVASKCARK